MPTVVVASRVNQLDPNIRVDEYTYGKRVVEVMHIGVHGCIIYDVTRDEWVSDNSEYLTPLAAQLRAFEVLGLTSDSEERSGVTKETKHG